MKDDNQQNRNEEHIAYSVLADEWGSNQRFLHYNISIFCVQIEEPGSITSGIDQLVCDNILQV